MREKRLSTHPDPSGPTHEACTPHFMGEPLQSTPTADMKGQWQGPRVVSSQWAESTPLVAPPPVPAASLGDTQVLGVLSLPQVFATLHIPRLVKSQTRLKSNSRQACLMGGAVGTHTLHPASPAFAFSQVCDPHPANCRGMTAFTLVTEGSANAMPAPHPGPL